MEQKGVLRALTREEAIKVFAELNYAYKADEYGDYFYDHGDEVCQAASMAIVALREHEERSKGCKACEMTTRGLTYKQIEYGALRGDFINDSGGMYIIRYEGGQHSIVCDDDGTEIDIEFCPMCGRRLEEV